MLRRRWGSGPELRWPGWTRRASFRSVDGLVEQWLGAVEIDLGRRVETDPPGVIGPLTELTADYPFREGLWALLMTALYRVGRQADALAAFQHARSHLVEQLGVEPGPRLKDVESRILDQDERLRGGARAESPSAHPTGTVTFGFCEVEDAARLWATNPKKTAAAMARLDELVRATVDRQDGFLFVIGGESFGAAFHRADDAAAWATELQLGVSSEPWPGGVELRLRIGLHTGETEDDRERLLRCCRERGAAARQCWARRPNPFVRSHCRLAGPQRPP